ncbi:MAG: aminotransferase class I/II-fold pyridoxal phosphate-dependent enzyme, partial [Candidatus Dadabacteria bacterium]|nr:aminotransferase class I/II-fold pyridoxal phosphate-dependent enzyme [Candidatus Dadabacteria bacterium]NIQ16740.1 aminotransferase class I/II-fold pyridoxal phosphate-dependent enzyme [Candidatus Dadabacteria bacterium]
MKSDLVKEISPFYVMDVLERAKQIEKEGKDVVHFEVGEPDFNTPENVCKSAVDSIYKGRTKYTSSLGIDELRKTISDDYNDKYGVNTDYNNVIITMGSSPALLLSILTTINPGDEIIITDPYYACYPQIINIARGVSKKIPIYEEDNYQINIKKLKSQISKRTKAIIINSPSNPTGTILEPEIMKKLSQLGVMVI